MLNKIYFCDVYKKKKIDIGSMNNWKYTKKKNHKTFVKFVLQADEEEKDKLKIRIEAAIAALNDPPSPMSM